MPRATGVVGAWQLYDTVMSSGLGSVVGMDRSQAQVVALPADASGLVVGAAGTGKTSAILARTARLLRAGDVRADDVLILTPTRQTATDLRDRVTADLDIATPGPLARSVASFAFQIVRSRAVTAGDPLPQLLTAPDQDAVIADLLEGDEADAAEGASRWPESLGTAVRRSRGFRSELRALFALATELGLAPQDLERLGADRANPVWSAAGSFWREYRYVLDRLRPAHRDPAEVLREATESLLLGGVTTMPSLLMVDDAQELSWGAVALLEAARVRGIAVLAFGDPDVGSGAFRGAGPETFARLASMFTDRFVLRHPYRARPALVRVARTVAGSIGTAGAVEHRLAPDAEPAPVEPAAEPVASGGAGEITTMWAASPHEELDGIARTLRSWHVAEGLPWREIAVIAHDTRQVARLTAELAAREVPTRAASAARPLGEEPAVRGLLHLVRLGMMPAVERPAEELAAALTSPFGGLDAIGLRRLRAVLRTQEFEGETRRAASELLTEAMAEPAALLLIDTPQARTAYRLAQTLAQIHAGAAHGDSAHELLWLAWDRSQLAGAWRERARLGGAEGAEATRSLDALVALFAAAKRSAEREDEDPARFLADILGSEVPEDSLAAAQRRDVVEILTPAGSLGREFEAVVIAGVQEGVWPNTRLRGSLLDGWRLADEAEAWRHGGTPVALDVLDRRRSVLHEELRLFERALTRAGTRLLVTAVDDEDQSPSALFSYLPEPPPRRSDRHPLTLRGAVAGYRRKLTETADPAVAEHAATQLAALARAGVPGADPASWYGVRERTGEGGIHDLHRAPVSISPSRVEAFEECGLDWAIRELGGDSRTFSAGLGTILHAAMETAPDGTFELLDAIVEERWGELDFEADWLSKQERQWATTLTRRLASYLREFAARGGEVAGAEARFRIAIVAGSDGPNVVAITAPGSPPAGTVAIISGSIDRVERWVENADPRVAVIDLKTGRSEARVSDDKVATDAQLAAYQLAVGAGAVPGAEQGQLVGARLLVLSKTLKGTDYRMAQQMPLDADTRSALLERIVADAEAMAAHSFTAYPDVHCNDDHFAVCRLHTVKPVSAP